MRLSLTFCWTHRIRSALAAAEDGLHLSTALAMYGVDALTLQVRILFDLMHATVLVDRGAAALQDAALAGEATEAVEMLLSRIETSRGIDPCRRVLDALCIAQCVELNLRVALLCAEPLKHCAWGSVLDPSKAFDRARQALLLLQRAAMSFLPLKGRAAAYAAVLRDAKQRAEGSADVVKDSARGEDYESSADSVTHSELERARSTALALDLVYDAALISYMAARFAPTKSLRNDQRRRALRALRKLGVSNGARPLLWPPAPLNRHAACPSAR